MVADCCVVTFLCPTVNTAVDLPAGTVTDAGTVAAAVFELLNVTTIPPVGAVPVSVIVPVTFVDADPFTEVGLRVTVPSAAGVIERGAV